MPTLQDRLIQFALPNPRYRSRWRNPFGGYDPRWNVQLPPLGAQAALPVAPTPGLGAQTALPVSPNPQPALPAALPVAPTITRRALTKKDFPNAHWGQDNLDNWTAINTLRLQCNEYRGWCLKLRTYLTSNYPWFERHTELFPPIYQAVEPPEGTQFEYVYQYKEYWENQLKPIVKEYERLQQLVSIADRFKYPGGYDINGLRKAIHEWHRTYYHTT